MGMSDYALEVEENHRISQLQEDSQRLACVESELEETDRRYKELVRVMREIEGVSLWAPIGSTLYNIHMAAHKAVQEATE